MPIRNIFEYPLFTAGINIIKMLWQQYTQQNLTVHVKMPTKLSRKCLTVSFGAQKQQKKNSLLLFHGYSFNILYCWEGQAYMYLNNNKELVGAFT